MEILICIIHLNAGVNGSLEVTLLKGRQAFDVDSTSNLGVAKIITWWILDVFYLGKSESSPYFLQEEVNLCLIFVGLWWILNVYFTGRSERSSNEKNPACERAPNVFARSSSRVRVRCSHLFWLVSISFSYVWSTIIEAANGRLKKKCTALMRLLQFLSARVKAMHVRWLVMCDISAFLWGKRVQAPN